MTDSSLRQRYVDMRSGGFYAWDVIANVFWADEVFAGIMGFSPSELNEGLPAERMMSIIHEDDAPHVAEAINNSIFAGEPFEMVYRVKKGDLYVTVTEIGKCYRYKDGVATLFSGVVFESGRSDGAAIASNANLPETGRTSGG